MPIRGDRLTKAVRSTSSDADHPESAIAEGATASRVMPVAGLVSGAAPGLVRRRGEPNDPLGGTEVSAELDGLLSRRRGRGEPLPPDIAQPMGEALGASLDAVRIHTGDEPAQLARSLQAQAFTRGADIYFGAGSYAPRTPAGQRLLAHELAHTVQQGAGGGSGAGPIIGTAADPAEAEADRVADGVMQVLRRRAIRRTDPADSAGDRASIGLDPLRRAQQSGAMAEPEPFRRAQARPLDRLRRVERTDSSPEVTASGPTRRMSANGWRHLRRPTPEQNPSAVPAATTVAGPGSPARHASIRRFYAVVHEPREGVEYKRVGNVPYVWLDSQFIEKDWVVSDVVTGWSVYKLYEWSRSKIAAENERKTAEAEALKQQEEAAIAAQKELEDEAAEALRKQNEAAAELERKQRETTAEAARQRVEAEAAKAQLVAAQLAEDKRVAEERARVEEEKKRKAAEREAEEKAAAAKREVEKKRKAAEREVADKAAAKKKAEKEIKLAAEKAAVEKKAAEKKATAEAEAKRLAAAREVREEKARQRAVDEVRAAEEKVAADKEEAERLRVEQQRLKVEADKLRIAAEEKEREEQARLAEARATAAREEADRLKREAEAKADEEARAKAEAEARAKAEERARADAEAKAKAEGEERARIEAEEKASAEAKVAAEAEAAAKAEAAEKAKAAVTGPSPDAKGSDAVVSSAAGAVVGTVASSPVVPVPLGDGYDPLAFGADQKFGNEPFSFDITTEDSAVKVHLAGLFAGLKAETSKAKNDKITDLFAEPHFKVHKSATTEDQKKARTQAVKGPYPKLIRHGPIDKRLEAAPAFAAKYALRAGSADTKRKSIIDKSTGESVGVLLIGITDAFAKAPAQPGRRQGMTKKHKLKEDATHVVDSAGVPTRRFAYFETSRQQLMDGLGPSGMGALRGRYPRFREAMGLPSTLNTIDQNDASVAQMYGGVGVVGDDKNVTVPQDVMAHTHQYLGNGLNQRGISLASTKKEQVYSNDGDPFKSDDGVRIEVDLSLVPEDVVLFNHYAEGGVGSRLANNPAFPKGMLEPSRGKKSDGGRAYAYANSVVKNRELLLEKLKPEWIVGLTDHLKDSMPGSGGPAGRLAGPGDAKGLSVDQLRAAVGFDAYERGRADVKARKEKDTTLTGFDEQNYNLGWSTGNEEVLGANAAVKDCSDFWIGFTAQPLPPAVPEKKSKRQILKEKEAKKPPSAPDVSTARAFGALSAEKITDRAERLRLQNSKPAWYVLAQLRFVKIGDKLFRPTMHDSFWLAWAATMKTPPTPVVAASTVPHEGAGAEDPVLTT